MKPKQAARDRFSVATAVAALGVFATAFGTYLIYEKVYLSIRAGETMERIGLIVKEYEPISFWIQVSLYGFFGGLITLAGIACLLRAGRAFIALTSRDRKDL